MFIKSFELTELPKTIGPTIPNLHQLVFANQIISLLNHFMYPTECTRFNGNSKKNLHSYIRAVSQ